MFWIFIIIGNAISISWGLYIWLGTDLPGYIGLPLGIAFGWFFYDLVCSRVLGRIFALLYEPKDQWPVSRSSFRPLLRWLWGIMTAQETDLILIDGVQHDLFTNPLEAYREKYRRDMIFLEDHPNTACWRGYVAEWEFDEGRLFLLKVVGNIS